MTSSASRTKPRIAHVLPWPAIGGTELGTFRIAEAVRSEFDAVGFCVPGADPVRDLFQEAGFETVHYEPVEPALRDLPRFVAASLELAREFRRRRVSLVHCADLLAGYHAAIAGWLAGVPVVCHIRCAYEDLDPRYAWFLRPVSKFLFVSENTWTVFGHSVPRERGVVLYDGLHSAAGPTNVPERERVRTALGISSAAPVIGMVARVAPAKDFATLIRAAEQLCPEYPDLRFLIVGDHSSTLEYRQHFRHVRSWLSDAGLDDRFVFTGHRTDVPKLVDAMDLVVLCTHGEGMPLVVLEAMARGKPVLATGVGGIPELIEDGRSGLLHCHKDHRRLATQLTTLLDHPQRAKQLGDRAADRVREHFSSGRFAANLTHLYWELLDRPAPAPRQTEFASVAT